MNRAILVCKKYVEVAKGFGSKEIFAVATSAAREAHNHLDFLDRLQKEAGISVSIISGMEEARLIYLGLSAGININNKIVLFIDIGGGSTEIMLGDQEHYYDLESLGLGAIRLTSVFLSDEGAKPISSEKYQKMKRYVQKKMVRVTERINQKQIELAVGSSGTIINLAEIACKTFNHDIDRNHLVLKYKELQSVIETLCSLPLNKRKDLPGINPDRADIIVSGAVILETFMEKFELKEILVSYRDMRHGMLIDYLQRHQGFPPDKTGSVREDSIMHLGRLFNINERHAKVVESLAVQLFDKAKVVHLHDFEEEEKELLRYAAFLHDIGNFISFRGHHLHSYYIMSNAELLGFNQTEITIMANVVRFHRKKLPKKNEPSFVELDKNEEHIVRVLSLLLRLAEKLDRSHNHLVRQVDFKIVNSSDTILLTLFCSEGVCELERWGVEADRTSFEHVFGKKLKIQVSDLLPTSMEKDAKEKLR